MADDARRLDPTHFKTVYVDRALRFAFVIDEASGRTFVSISVSNPYVDYEEYYEVARATFDRFTANPSLAHGFVAHAKNRELDPLLLFPPGAMRGFP